MATFDDLFGFAAAQAASSSTSTAANRRQSARVASTKDVPVVGHKRGYAAAASSPAVPSSSSQYTSSLSFDLAAPPIKKSGSNGTLLDQVAEMQAQSVSPVHNTISLDDLKNNQADVNRDRRRERNKVLARKTRCKKKAEFDFLRRQLVTLQEDNERMKAEVAASRSVPFAARVLLGGDVDLPEALAAVIREIIATVETSDVSLRRTAEPHHQHRSFCIANPAAPDCPIVYCSPGFSQLTGYEMSNIVGRNCRFLQGAGTSRTDIDRLKRASVEGREEVVVVKNYKKDGTPFWNRVQLVPLRDASDKVAFIVGLQYEVHGPAPAGGPLLTALTADRLGYTLGGGTTVRSRLPRDGSSKSSSSSSSSSSLGSIADGPHAALAYSKTGIAPTDTCISALCSVITQGVHRHHYAASAAPTSLPRGSGCAQQQQQQQQQQQVQQRAPLPCIDGSGSSGEGTTSCSRNSSSEACGSSDDAFSHDGDASM